MNTNFSAIRLWISVSKYCMMKLDVQNFTLYLVCVQLRSNRAISVLDEGQTTF